MNSILITNEEISKQRLVTLKDFRLVHIKEILRSQLNDTLRITILNHGLTQATLLSLGDKECTLQISPLDPVKEQNLLNVDVAIGFSRPPTIKKILEHATTFGVQKFFFYPTVLSEKSYAQSSIYERNNLFELLSKGLMQSNCYYQLPEVERLQHFDQLKKKFSSYQQIFLLSLNGKKTLLNYPSDKKTLLILGGERGLTASEEESLISPHLFPITISKSTLRVENATFAALAQLELLRLPSYDTN